MEKEPKIGKSLEGDAAIPEFQTKEPKIELGEDTYESKKEIVQTLRENEGGAISESLEESWDKTWFEVVLEAKSEFPPYIQDIIEKRGKGERVPRDEYLKFKIFIDSWWKERFGDFIWGIENLNEKKSKKSKSGEKRKRRKENKLNRFKDRKIKRMKHLEGGLKDLDQGEPVDEFKDETRRVVYYDEGLGMYFIEENDQKKYLGVGDILSDYAWGIKYVPDGEMIEPAYRQISKRILVNETRRDIEVIYDQELGTKVNDASPRPSIDTLEKNKEFATGFIAEIVVRELLNRLSFNHGLDFIVMRANSLEDGVYKYDFKIRAKSRNRGIAIEDGPTIGGKVFKIGIQLKTYLDKKGLGTSIGIHSYSKGIKKLVDDVMILSVRTKEFYEIFQKWLDEGKPSGGPEQFLSRDLKVKLLKEVIKGLVNISDEDIEKIFSKEENLLKIEQVAV
ncbi:MAG: hypothetical protein Q7S43_04245 [bacterium]|nr:hypothetical protein [bacterium]